MKNTTSRKTQNLCTTCIICYNIPPNSKRSEWTNWRFLNLLVLPEALLISNERLLNIFKPAQQTTLC